MSAFIEKYNEESCQIHFDQGANTLTHSHSHAKQKDCFDLFYAYTENLGKSEAFKWKNLLQANIDRIDACIIEKKLFIASQDPPLQNFAAALEHRIKTEEQLLYDLQDLQKALLLKFLKIT